ncbi:sodium-coupled monocarboxylate transporter 1 isoform X2 [Lates calcarifer]|uniref:Sodium-coupled monocarboxylate transporter 1 isoform X2 n=1 Tax=Lates calcarifer TaxID=8187 RepID=A0AAJ7LAX2_LATCA|nr:sodium-coupled monocarboxylate transporter 1 isoform X2 [Lates calcarifer]
MVGTGGPVATFSVWDYVVFAGTILGAAGIGLFQAIRGRKETSSDEFLLGGRQMTAVPVAMSLTASFMSGITVIGTPAEAYRFGAAFWLFGFAYAIMSAVTAEIFVPLFYRLGITSAYEYLEMRFSRPIRIIGTSMYIAQTALYTGLVIYAPALALNQITGLNLWGVLVATGAVCILYCTLGGLKAVIWTDVLQMVIMLAGFVAVIARGAVLQGGLTKIWEDAGQGGRLEAFDTVSSSINALVAVTVEDFIHPVCKNLTDKQVTWMNMGLSVFFGALCIGMAGVASVMGSVLQAALSIFGMISGPLLGLYLLGMLFRTSNSIGGLLGMIIGLVLTLWVGIGAQIYPPTDEKTNPLPLSIAGCNSTLSQNYTTIAPWTSPVTVRPDVRPPLADSWYSLSYLHFCLLGTLTTMVSGLLVSMITGGCKQEKLNSDLFVRKRDLICFSCLSKSKASDVTEKAATEFNVGADNSAFTELDVMGKDVENATKL